MTNTPSSLLSLAFAAQLTLLTLAFACGDDDGMTRGADGSLPGEGLENCANGVDDDGDGDTDCADLDCLVGVLDTSAPKRTWELMSWVVEPLPEGTCPPPQTIDGVLVPGEAMPRDRVASVNGRVIDSDGEPIRRARVRVLGREEAGAVETRADGRFDLLLDPRSRPVLVFGIRSPERVVDVAARRSAAPRRA